LPAVAAKQRRLVGGSGIEPLTPSTAGSNANRKFGDKGDTRQCAPSSRSPRPLWSHERKSNPHNSKIGKVAQERRSVTGFSSEGLGSSRAYAARRFRSPKAVTTLDKKGCFVSKSRRGSPRTFSFMSTSGALQPALPAGKNSSVLAPIDRELLHCICPLLAQSGHLLALR
jgi:hypothetical protein